MHTISSQRHTKARCLEKLPDTLGFHSILHRIADPAWHLGCAAAGVYGSVAGVFGLSSLLMHIHSMSQRDAHPGWHIGLRGRCSCGVGLCGCWGICLCGGWYRLLDDYLSMRCGCNDLGPSRRSSCHSCNAVQLHLDHRSILLAYFSMGAGSSIIASASGVAAVTLGPIITRAQAHRHQAVVPLLQLLAVKALALCMLSAKRGI